jgi:hypothetical protein
MRVAPGFNDLLATTTIARVLAQNDCQKPMFPLTFGVEL